MKMVRKQLYIDPGQDQKLKRLASELRVTEAEIVRRAIDDIEDRKSPGFPDREAGHRLIRMLRERAARFERTEGGRTWHREDAYEERGRFVSR